MAERYPRRAAHERSKDVECPHCGTVKKEGFMRAHEPACYLNPKNLRECVECGNPIKDYRKSQGTCSHSCSNRYFRHLRNKPENYTQYRTICFYHHEKKCIVCDEINIVEVHHYDGNHNNDNPKNLIPLCPTHHKYVHSKHKDKIQPIIDQYYGV